jgi:hypothetical protein
VEWTSPPTSTAKTPTSFLVFFGTNGAPDYGSPIATILYSTSIANAFTYNSATLTSNVTYTIGVRAANATATETNTNTVTAVSVGPRGHHLHCTDSGDTICTHRSRGHHL